MTLRRYNMGILGTVPLCHDAERRSLNFVSDNQAGAHPAVLAALQDANSGTSPGYGEDSLTAAAEEAVSAVFETNCEVFFVTTGTAADALAMSALCPPWGAIYCHEGAHIQNDENTAVELLTGGARMVAIAGEGGKPDPERMRAHMATATIHGVHNARPGAISLSNVTEAGTVYRPDDMAPYRALADEFQLALHVDGARFANAVVASTASPADLTWRAGVDCLSFGLTKNGGIAAEAVVMFNREMAEQFAYRRKRAGHLWSKQRYLAAQWLALLKEDLWLNNASHANAMAKELSTGLSAHSAIELPWSVDANELFPVIPPAIREELRAAGLAFYDCAARAETTSGSFSASAGKPFKTSAAASISPSLI